MSGNIGVWVVGVAVVGISFGLGYMTSPSLVTSPEVESTSLSSPKARNSSSFRQLEELSYEDFSQQFVVRGPRRLHELLTAALQEKDPLKRNASLGLLLQNLNPETLSSVLEAYEELPSQRGWRNIQQLSMLMYAWGKFDGAGAIEFAREKQQGGAQWALVVAASRGWLGGGSPPSEIMEWSKTQGNQVQQQVVSGVISGVAEEDAARAAGMLDQYMAESNGRASTRLARSVVRQYAKQDINGASAWTLGIQNEQIRNDTAAVLLDDWVDTDPNEAVRWATTNSQLGGRAGRQVVQSLVGDDFDSAVSFVNGLPNGAMRTEAGATLIGTWTQNDPNAAGAWLNSQPSGKGKDRSIEVYARQIVNEDPEAAVDWATTISDEGRRKQVIVSVARNWKQKDAAAAEAWLNRSGLDEATIQRITGKK